MNGEDIINQFYWLTDDDIVDETQALILANECYDLVLASEFWHFLYSVDQSLTIAANDTTYALPADFLFSHNIILRQNATSSTYVECMQVPYANRFEHLGDQTKYYIDQKNSLITFCSAPNTYAGWLLIHNYQYQPAQIALATSPVFNRAFHSLLAYDMAKKYYYNDQGEKSRSWNAEMEFERNRYLAGLRTWDANNRYGAQPMANPFNYAPQLN